jgi:hypothetical protein
MGSAEGLSEPSHLYKFGWAQQRLSAAFGRRVEPFWLSVRCRWLAARCAVLRDGQARPGGWHAGMLQDFDDGGPSRAPGAGLSAAGHPVVTAPAARGFAGGCAGPGCWFHGTPATAEAVTPRRSPATAGSRPPAVHPHRPAGSIAGPHASVRGWAEPRQPTPGSSKGPKSGPGSKESIMSRFRTSQQANPERTRSWQSQRFTNG